MLALRKAILSSSQGAAFVAASNGSNSSTTTHTINTPAGATDGDLLLWFCGFAYSGGGNITPTTPAGWNVLESDVLSVGASRIYWKRHVAGTSSYSVTTDNPGGSTLEMHAWRNVNDPVVKTVQVNGSSTVNATAAALTVDCSGAALVFAAILGTSGSAPTYTPPSGFTEISDTSAQDVNKYVSMETAYKVNPATGSTGAITATISSANTSIATLIELTPSSFTPPVPVLISSASSETAAGSPNLVINKPASILIGDLLLAVMGSDGPAFWTGDTGWTEIYDSGGTHGLCLAYKVATGSEPSSYTFVADNSSRALGGVVLAYRGAAYDTIGTAFTATPPFTVNGVTCAANYSLMLAVGLCRTASKTFTAPSTMATDFFDNNTNPVSFGVFRETVVAGATGSRTITSNASTGLTIAVSLKPA